MTPPRRGGSGGHSKAARGKRPRLRAVRPRRARRPRHLPFLIACFLLVGSLVVAVVSVQAVVAQSAFRMQQLTRRHAEQSQASGRLQLEIAQLSAPRRIAREARRLGYRLPGRGEIHTVTVGGRP